MQKQAGQHGPGILPRALSGYSVRGTVPRTLTGVPCPQPLSSPPGGRGSRMRKRPAPRTERVFRVPYTLRCGADEAGAEECGFACPAAALARAGWDVWRFRSSVRRRSPLEKHFRKKSLALDILSEKDYNNTNRLLLCRTGFRPFLHRTAAPFRDAPRRTGWNGRRTVRSNVRVG